MSRIRIIDIIVVVVLIAVWGFYFSYEGRTGLDLSRTLTLPLLIAVDFTALAVLYVVFRYYRNKVKTDKFSLGQLLPTAMRNPPDKEGTADKEDTINKEDNK